MTTTTERTCPLCQTPRPPRAKRCACNYVFEYERLGGTDQPSESSSGLGLLPVLIAIAAVACVVVALTFKPGRHAPAGWFLVPAGAFSVCGAVFDWQFFMGDRRARWPVAILGRSGARVFYAAIGGALAGAGIVLI